ncbi:gamma carbonic anhydrase family protein [Methylobacterium sp.]|jgi:carbonic anhydrase/acetyltransferase-like protein (isoleucine patch superfamily)|uniref:gamma carbonic anhydrase family protein n=1 Tax=Methylobacterium sp. TaxID=409 RepID=UPI0026101C00|nr:gamma carbonic anhydrase family protein [Methylobacterium sp.]MDB5646791.1 transferase hexapeptide repeat containing protein [Methylobacterium sp.]
MTLYALGPHRPQLADPDRVWIAPGAHVVGQVHLGRDVSIWFGAVLRGDNDTIRIGDRCNVQDGAVLHADPGFPLELGDDVTVGHRAIVHGCTIGAGTLVGMGATILNGARIGRNCLVGANALVTEGKEFPDNSLIVGAPAKVARTLDPEAAGKLARTAENYVANGRRFSADLRAL